MHATVTKRQGMMFPFHPRWEEFRERLEGPEGCNFQEKTPGDPKSIIWTCDNTLDKPLCRKILTAMGLNPQDIEWSLGYFTGSGRHCDCEVIFNVHHPERIPKPHRKRRA
jgi:hypothetical protein